MSSSSNSSRTLSSIRSPLMTCAIPSTRPFRVFANPREIFTKNLSTRLPFNLGPLPGSFVQILPISKNVYYQSHRNQKKRNIHQSLFEIRNVQRIGDDDQGKKC